MGGGEDGSAGIDPPIEGYAPLLLHVDVNKSIIISDMIMNKSVEYTIREVIANQFWGTVSAKADEPEESIWIWDGRGPSPLPKSAELNGNKLVNYLNFCRKKIKDKSAARLATRSFDLAGDAECKKQMNDVVEEVIDKMTIPAKERTEELTSDAGLVGEWRLIFPSFFQAVAALQRRGCKFSIFFRSFGSDLPRIRIEWNAFCEMRHPLYNHYLDGIGPMDGSVEGVPDRRLGEEDLHTMYRDSQGPLMALNIMTNGNWEGEWDQWARSENSQDTRDGRSYFKNEGIRTLNGYSKIRGWMRQQVKTGRSQLIRDDFAWWHWNGEVNSAGKLMVGIKDLTQVFFDDNVGAEGLRIVDARTSKDYESVDQILQPEMGCVRVDTLRAMLSEDYFKGEALRAAANVHSLRSPESIQEALKFLRWTPDMPDSENSEQDADEDSGFSTPSRKRGSFRPGEEKGTPRDMAEDKSNDDGALEVTDAEHLEKVLREAGVEVEKFGAPGTTYKTVATLFDETKQGKCFLKRDVDRDSLGGTPEQEAGEDKPRTIMPVVRMMEVVRVKLSCNNLILCEAHEQLSDGRMRSRNGYLPATKRRRGESLLEAVSRWSVEELQIKLTDDQKQEAVQSVTEKYDVTDETMSFPIPCATHYFEVNCRLRPEKMESILQDRIGLPSGSMFSTAAVKKKKGGAAQKAGSRMFWSWYRKEVWEAMQTAEAVELPDVQAGMEILFKGNTRRKGYSALLLQMFDCFTATHLAGGMSGSLVLQVQPVDPVSGKNQEPVIVKLDKADVVSREIVFSKRVCNVLSDRAARILGDGCFVTDDQQVEYGAFKIELAGGCWQVPELAGGSKAKDLLSTFKDLFVVESERQLLNDAMIEENFQSVHGDVEVVLRELLGPGGMLRVLRREGLDRNPRNLFQSYFYFGKDSKWNPLFKGEGHFQLNPMRELWRRTFGAKDGSELPNVRDQVLELRAEFEKLEKAEAPITKYRPVVGLAHGDLNAMNVLIDVMDAVWLIDFAFSEEKPLCWDLSKMEIAYMFEYAILPVCWRTLLRFAGDTEEDWKERKVEKWLNVSQDGTIALLKELQKLEKTWDNVGQKESPKGSRAPSRRKATWKNENRYRLLSDAIQRACDAAWPEPLDATKQKKKDTELCRLNATLVATEAEEESAMAVVKEVTDAMMCGTDLNSCLETPAISSTAQNAPEAASILWCWAKCARLRMFLKEEWQTLQVRVQRELGNLMKADQSPLVFWLGLLQESYRLLGYFDVAPWVKVWACHYLERLVKQIRENYNPQDALEVLVPLSPARRASFVKEHKVIRPAPDASERTLRGMALRDDESKIPYEVSAQEIRVRNIHATNDAISSEGGLFVEVGKAVKVTVGSTECRQVRMVEKDSLNSEDSDNIYPISVGDVEVGAVQINGEENLAKGGANALVMLNTEVVPVPASVMDKELLLQVPLSSQNADDVHITLWVRTKQDTIFCYPHGARLRLTLDAANKEGGEPIRPSGRLRHATVLHLDRKTGNYAVRWDNDRESFREPVLVNPRRTNHLRAETCTYQPGSKLVIYRALEDGASSADDTHGERKQELGEFVEAMVVECLGEQDATDGARADSRHIVCSGKKGSGEDSPSSPTLAGANQDEWIVDLNDFNHALRGSLGMKDLEDELRRYKIFIKAKHSLLWTVTSERCDCLEGPVPRIADEMGQELNFWQEVQSLISEEDERISSHVFNQGMIILGQAGSGKTCILCKMVMNCLSRSKMLLPLFIPVTDLCARLEKAATGEIKSNADSSIADDNGEGLVDWYLRAVYGDDTSRYFMLRQALQCHRLLLLFDGLDEGGKQTGRVERCITSLVAQDHRVIATARPQEESSFCSSPPTPKTPRRARYQALHPNWLQTTPSLFRIVELMPLSMNCRKTLVEVLLSKDSELTKEDTDMAESFCTEFLESLEEDERRKWSTPLMVAMLIASWRAKKREELEKTHENKDSSWKKKTLRRQGTQDAATIEKNRRDSDAGKKTEQSAEEHKQKIKSVYGVALDLLLRRFQSRQQADRHKMKARVESFKSLLEVIASKMTEEGIKFFTEADVVPIVEENEIDAEVWTDLADAIKEGRVPLLRAFVDEDVDEIRFVFAYSSFQNFLSSSATLSKKASFDLLPTPEVKAQESPKKRHSWAAALRARSDTSGSLEEDVPLLTRLDKSKRRLNTIGVCGILRKMDLDVEEDEDDDSPKNQEVVQNQEKAEALQQYSPRMPPLPKPEKTGRRLSNPSSHANKTLNGNGIANGHHNGFCNGISKRPITPVTRNSQVAGELLDLRRDDSKSSMPPPPCLSSLRGSAARSRSSSLVQPLPPPKAGTNDLLPARSEVPP